MMMMMMKVVKVMRVFRMIHRKKIKLGRNKDLYQALGSRYNSKLMKRRIRKMKEISMGTIRIIKGKFRNLVKKKIL